MGFTTNIFIFIFFPICFTIYYFIELLRQKRILSEVLKKYRVTDLVLIMVSGCFYAWTCFDDVFKLFTYILIVFMFGRWIRKVCQSDLYIVLVQKKDGENKKYISPAIFLLIVAIILIIFVLIHFKYTELLARIWNFFFLDTITKKSIIAPLGLSFITFSAISYLTDIYLGKAEAGSLVDCMLYLTFFPKVVSGPIVLWRDFGSQIGERKVSLYLISDGISRIMIGFAKKLILADTFGSCIASISDAIDIPTAFGIGLLYMLQIYYDFSGYSDIAIGLAEMLGFSFENNFNFPYISCSITEFWRRWHISLGMWFREYIYFPLGGSRINKSRTMINIGVVFLLTGIWHGAGLTYLLWGGANGICNMIEKLLKTYKAYQKVPRIVKWILTMGITYFSWGLFQFNSFASYIKWIWIMFGWNRCSNIPFTWQYYFDIRMVTLIFIGVFGATFLGLPAVQTRYQEFVQTRYGYMIQQMAFVILFIISIMFMVNSDYSPFIYFQY